LSTSNPTQTALGSNPGSRGVWLALNCLSCGSVHIETKFKGDIDFSFVVHILKRGNKFKIILKFITVLDLCIKHFVNCCIPVYLISEIVSDQRNRCFYFQWALLMIAIIITMVLE
jgi:hypothetical protein